MHPAPILLRTFEDAYYQYQHGASDEEAWNGYEQLCIANALSPGFQLYWKQRRDTFRPAFRKFIDDHDRPVALTWGRLAPELGGVQNRAWQAGAAYAHCVRALENTARWGPPSDQKRRRRR
jgi:hypothetical protein